MMNYQTPSLVTRPLSAVTMAKKKETKAPKPITIEEQIHDLQRKEVMGSMQ